MQKIGMTYPIGLDLRPGEFFAAQIERSGKTMRIRDAMHWHLEEISETETFFETSLPDLLKELKKNKHFRGKRVVLRLDSPEVFSFPLRFQAADNEDPEQVILRESRKHIPFDLEEAVVDYSSLSLVDSDKTNSYACIVLAAKREYVNRCLLVFKNIGLDVRVMEYGALSLIRLHDHLVGMTLEPIILCYLGRKQTIISFASRDRIYAERHLPWGVEMCIDKIKSNLVQDEVRARYLLSRYGLNYGIMDNSKTGEFKELDKETLRVVYQVVISPLEKMVHEFHRLFAYIRSEERQIQFKKIILYGHFEVVRGLESYLSVSMNLPVHRINPVQYIRTAPKCRFSELEIDSGFSLALGLSLRRVSWL